MSRFVPGACLFALFLALAPTAAADDEVARLAARIGLAQGAVVAEIGAGDGSFAVELAKRVGPEGRVYATELEPEQLDAIRATASAAGVANVEVREAKVEATNLPDACCDAIVMRNVYHHLTAPAALDRDVVRALRPGGYLVVIDFPPTWFLQLFTPEGVDESRSRHGITPEDAIAELQAAGLEAIETIPDWQESWIGPDRFALVMRKPAAP